MIDFTPQLKEMALKAIEGYRLGPLFTPPSFVDAAKGTKGTLTFPGSGGANWEGGGLDPETGYLYVASATRTDTALYGLTRPTPGETDIEVIGTGSVAPTVAGTADRQTAMGTHYRYRSQSRRHRVADSERRHAARVKNHPLLKGVTLPRTGKPVARRHSRHEDAAVRG